MKQDKREVIDEILKTFKFNSHFETDKFIYWTREFYLYNGQSMSRDEFQCVKDYVVKYGTLPFLDLEERAEKNVKGDGFVVIDKIERNINTDTRGSQEILRYSKQYDSIEFYNFNQEVRATTKNKTGRVIVISKKEKIFSVNNKNHVLINGNRWLSLKNIFKFIIANNRITIKSGLLLLNMMLGGDKQWILNLEDEWNGGGQHAILYNK